MKFVLTILFIISFFSVSKSQNLYSLHTKWDDDFQQWELKLNEGELEGDIEMLWRLRNDIREWTYKIDGQRGSIKQKWDNNLNTWELRSPNEVINISTVWSGDFSSFRISNGDITIKVERTHIQRDPIEWVISDQKEGNFTWYNEFEYDLRDWVIIDELGEGISLEMKLAAVFVTVLFSFIK